MIGLACAAALLVVLGIEDAAAATRQWDGSSGTLWSDPANWVGDQAPVNGDDLLFPTFGSNTTNQNDIPGLQVNSVRFMFTSYLITGQPITIGAGGMIIGSGDAYAFSGHLSRRMLEHYSHIRIDAKRQSAVEPVSAIR